MASSCMAKTCSSSIRSHLSLSSCGRASSVVAKGIRAGGGLLELRQPETGKKLFTCASLRIAGRKEAVVGIYEGCVTKPAILSCERLRRQPFGNCRSLRGVVAGTSDRRCRCFVVMAATADRDGGVSSSSSSPPGSALPTLGFLGLGIMGEAMAHNLVKAGYDVTVWNRTASKCEPLIKEGAKVGLTPRDVTEACDITFAMLADPAGALHVACGENGAVFGLGPGKGYVDVSTVDGDTSKQINKAVKAAGGDFLEAPVSGSKKPAIDGTLIFLTAGDQALYDRASLALDVMGKARFYLGEVGKGAAMKLVVNMVMGSMMASFSEGLALGAKVGLDASALLEVISLGAINTPMFNMKGPSMIKGSYAPAFPLKHQQKDMRLALALGEEVLQPLPVAASANEVYKQARATGLGDDDFSAVYEAIKTAKS